MTDYASDLCPVALTVSTVDYDITVNDVKVTGSNKEDVLGNGKVRYAPADNTLYAEDLCAADLTVAGNGSTIVHVNSTIGAPAAGALTVTGAKDVTVTENAGAPAIYREANITCTGNVEIVCSSGMAVTAPLTVTGAQDVTITANSSNPAIGGTVNIVCSSGIAVNSALTVKNAQDVIVTANSSNPAIGGTADITCSGDVIISNSNSDGKAMGDQLTYRSTGDHGYTVKTGSSLESLSDYAANGADQTFGPVALDAPAVKITTAHNLTHVAAKDATCTENGNLEHWICSLCGQLFSDANGTTETTAETVTIGAAGHTADEWQSSSTQHWQVCTKCGSEFNRADHTFSDSTCTECDYTKPSTDIDSPTYSVALKKTVKGTVTVSSEKAAKGDTVTLTVTPDKGYTLKKLTVTDADDTKIGLTNKGDGNYTFTMPASEVTVKAIFKKIKSKYSVAVDKTVKGTIKATFMKDKCQGGCLGRGKRDHHQH